MGRRDAPEDPALDVDIPVTTGTARLTRESDGSTTVWVNSVPSSTLPSPDGELHFEYMRHIAAAVAAWGGAERMLAMHIGAAACTLPAHLALAYPQSRHIAVDSDAELVRLAREWTDLPRAPRLRIRAQDGLEALSSRQEESLDLIVRDAFAGDTTPAHLAGPQWWGHAQRVLRPGGLIVANIGTRPGDMTHIADARAASETGLPLTAIGEGAVLKGRRRGNVVLVVGQVVVDDVRRYAASAPLPTSVATTWPGAR